MLALVSAGSARGFENFGFYSDQEAHELAALMAGGSVATQQSVQTFEPWGVPPEPQQSDNSDNQRAAEYLRNKQAKLAAYNAQYSVRYKANKQEAFYEYLMTQKLYDGNSYHKVNTARLLERLHQDGLNNDIDAPMLIDALSGYKANSFSGDMPVTADRVRKLAQSYQKKLVKNSSRKKAGAAVAKSPQQLSWEQLDAAMGISRSSDAAQNQ